MQTGRLEQHSASGGSRGRSVQIGRSALGSLRGAAELLLRPLYILRGYRARFLQADIVAGLTVAVVAIPQAVAFALIAELPPQAGLYAVIVGAIVGSLWGSSDQLQTGPTNTTSLLVLSVLVGVVSPGTPEYLAAAGLMAVMVGMLRLLMGLAHLGVLVNFVSDAVVVGFTAGAGLLITANQVRHLLRLPIASAPYLWETVAAIAVRLPGTHLPSLVIGLITIALTVTAKRAERRLPGPLIAIASAALVVGLLGLDALGVRVVGELPRRLPPLARLPVADMDLVGRLASGSIAVAAIGLVEAMSIARRFSSQTGQRLDSNQEFVGQGLANIACGFLSGYTGSGSFTRSAVNYEAGAKTALASVFAGIFVLLALLVLAPLAAFMPLSALAGVLILTGLELIDRKEIARIWRSGRQDRVIMLATLLATLALPLQYAVLTGVLLSVGYYLLRTSTPRVRTVLLSDDFRYFTPQPHKPSCPQLGVVEIMGDLYFGAVSHIENCIQQNLSENPSQRFLLLRMYTVENCDISGIYALESIAGTYRERGGDVYFVHVQSPVLQSMQASGFYAYLGEDHFLDPDEAVGYLFHRVLDPAVCIYECPFRVFRECQNLPKHLYPVHIDWDTDESLDIPTITPEALWGRLRGDDSITVVDVREPREFARGHVPGSRLIPVPALLAGAGRMPREQLAVLVCRSGRRSQRAAAALRSRGFERVMVLEGGMLAWERANLLEAMGEDED